MCPCREKPNAQTPPKVEQKSEQISVDGNGKLNSSCQLSELECTLPPNVTYMESIIFFPKDDLRPYVTVTTSNKELTGLLDTGSHVTAIGQNMYESGMYH